MIKMSIISSIVRVEKNHDLFKKSDFLKFKSDLLDLFDFSDFWEIWCIDIYIDV